MGILYITMVQQINKNFDSRRVPTVGFMYSDMEISGHHYSRLRLLCEQKIHHYPIHTRIPCANFRLNIAFLETNCFYGLRLETLRKHSFEISRIAILLMPMYQLKFTYLYFLIFISEEKSKVSKKIVFLFLSRKVTYASLAVQMKYSFI